MINLLISTIETKLKNLYPIYNIYKENVQQEAPAFFIGVKSSAIDQELSNRKRLEVNFEVVCTLSDANKNEQYWDIAMALTEALEDLEVDANKYKTFNAKSEIIEGALHYQFSIKTLLFKTILPTPKIQDIQNNSNIRSDSNG